MKKSAIVFLMLFVIAIVFSACRTHELCPAYQSKANVKIEKRS